MIIPFIRSQNNNAPEIAQYYIDIFGDNTKIVDSNPIVTSFEIYWQLLAALNGWNREQAIINPSISFSLWIKDKDETKRIWDRLSEGGFVMMPFDEYIWSPAYGRCNDKYWASRQVMYDNREETTQNQLIPSLMYTGKNNGKTKEAIDFYTNAFPNSKIDFTRPYGENNMWENPNNLNHAEFKLNNQQFIAMDSWLDHKFTFSEWISLAIECDGQEEVDHYWNILTSDWGHESMCWRCQDKYGVSRQIVPKQLIEAISQSDRDAAMYAMSRMQTMQKIVITDLYR